jgi:type VI secretion system protein VasJ
MNLQTLGVAPVNPENPAGEDVRYQPIFEGLQCEIDKLSSPSAAAASIDWGKVANLASEILADKSKDLLVSAYFCVSQITLGGVEGLELGLRVYADLLDNFWEDLFPAKKRMRGRIAAIEWWVERSEIAIGQIAPSMVEESVLSRIRVLCEHIDGVLGQHLPDPRPTVHPVLRAVETSLLLENQVAPPGGQELPAPQDDMVSQVQEIAAPQHIPPTTSAPEVRATQKTESDPGNTLSALVRSLQSLATGIFEQNQADPLSYRLLRFSLWAPVVNLPPIIDGKTIIPPPDPQMAAIVRDLLARGDWRQVVTAAEYQLSQYIFWLDLNRFSAIALENLGPSYKKAADCLAQETAFFLVRFPELVTFRFSDGTPFADKETGDWLESVSLAGAAFSIDQVPVSGGSSSDAVSEKILSIMPQCEDLVKGKNLLGAVALLQQEMQQAVSVKDKMLWRLALCRLLVVSGNAALALPHFELILEDIETHKLDKWDPAFALHGLKAVWAGYLKVSDKAVKEQSVRVLHQISRINPVEAIRIGK